MNEIEPSFPILQPFNKNWTPSFSRLTHDCVADVSVPDRFILSLTSLTSQQGGYKRVRFKCVLCNLLINPKLQNAPPPPYLLRALPHWPGQDLEDLFSEPFSHDSELFAFRNLHIKRYNSCIPLERLYPSLSSSYFLSQPSKVQIRLPLGTDDGLMPLGGLGGGVGKCWSFKMIGALWNNHYLQRRGIAIK